MKSLDVAPVNESRAKTWEQEENQRETSHNDGPLLDDPWKPQKPWQQSRSFVKGQTKLENR